jgi:hypothetical protein
MIVADYCFCFVFQIVCRSWALNFVQLKQNFVTHKDVVVPLAEMTKSGMLLQCSIVCQICV